MFFSVVIAGAQLIRFFGPILMFLLLMLIFLSYSYNMYFASQGKINTPGAILPSAKHFQTTTKKHFCINKKNNFTSYNYFMRQNIHSWSYFATS